VALKYCASATWIACRLFVERERLAASRHLLDGWDEQGDEDRDDRDHDEQLDEGESGFALGA
jgi:hypothetical protein